MSPQRFVTEEHNVQQPRGPIDTNPSTLPLQPGSVDEQDVGEPRALRSPPIEPVSSNPLHMRGCVGRGGKLRRRSWIGHHGWMADGKYHESWLADGKYLGGDYGVGH